MSGVIKLDSSRIVYFNSNADEHIDETLIPETNLDILEIELERTTNKNSSIKKDFINVPPKVQQKYLKKRNDSNLKDRQNFKHSIVPQLISQYLSNSYSHSYDDYFDLFIDNDDEFVELANEFLFNDYNNYLDCEMEYRYLCSLDDYEEGDYSEEDKDYYDEMNNFQFEDNDILENEYDQDNFDDYYSDLYFYA
jgi:hypothetical protein